MTWTAASVDGVFGGQRRAPSAPQRYSPDTTDSAVRNPALDADRDLAAGATLTDPLFALAVPSAVAGDSRGPRALTVRRERFCLRCAAIDTAVGLAFPLARARANAELHQLYERAGRESGFGHVGASLTALVRHRARQYSAARSLASRLSELHVLPRDAHSLPFEFDPDRDAGLLFAHFTVRTRAYADRGAAEFREVLDAAMAVLEC
jgi:hypothetical protein